MKKLRVDKGALKFVMSGANIMCPGLTSPGATIHDEVCLKVFETWLCRHEVAMGRGLQSCISHQHHLRPCQPICTALYEQVWLQLWRKPPTPHWGQRHICREISSVDLPRHRMLHQRAHLIGCSAGRSRRASCNLWWGQRACHGNWHHQNVHQRDERNQQRPWSWCCTLSEWWPLEDTTVCLTCSHYTAQRMIPCCTYHVLVDRAFLNFTIFFVSFFWGSSIPKAW